MASINVELDEDLAVLLQRVAQPVEQAARELIVMELYRRDCISSGKAAELLGMSKSQFIEYAGELGIPYFRLSADEVRADADRIRDAASRA